MFRFILSSSLLFMVVVVGLHYLVFRGRMKKDPQEKSKSMKRFEMIRILIGLVTFLCFIVLAFTGFYPALVLGKSLSGYSLMLHATAAPVFSVCVVVLAFTWGHSNRFTRRDWDCIRKTVGKSKWPVRSSSNYSIIFRKLFFWLLVVLTFPVSLSMIFSMFPWFGTEGQEWLFHVHRYSSIGIAVSAGMYGYLAAMTNHMLVR